MEDAIGAEEHGDFADHDDHPDVDHDGKVHHVHDRAPTEEPGQTHLNVLCALET